MGHVACAWHARLRGLWLAALLLTLLCGCASPRGAMTPGAHWQGRLALKVYSEPVQALSANFELQGAPDAGELTLSSSLGTTLARLRWDGQAATLQANGQVQQFASLALLARHVTGTDVPVASLFAWLRGDAEVVAGWDVDVHAIDQGRLLARRTEGVAADLKIILER